MEQLAENMIISYCNFTAQWMLDRAARLLSHFPPKGVPATERFLFNLPTNRLTYQQATSRDSDDLDNPRKRME
jgi:hypothetical protein